MNGKTNPMNRYDLLFESPFDTATGITRIVPADRGLPK